LGAQLFLLGACDDFNVPEAEVAATKPPEKGPPEPSEKPEEAPKPEVYEGEAQLENSQVAFVLTKATGQHTGHFDAFTAKVRYTKDALEELSIEIDVASLEADEPVFAEHVKSAAFLNVEKFPKATFKTEEVTGGGKQIKGKLTLRGVERPVSFEARLSQKDGVRIAEADLALSLREYGITNPLIEAEMVDDEVHLDVHLEFPPGK
jgi:polyisoprenoid-binding protein YceI